VKFVELGVVAVLFEVGGVVAGATSSENSSTVAVVSGVGGVCGWATSSENSSTVAVFS
jgi:hypothetical protein